MKNAHFHLFLLVLIVGFGALGYTSYRTIDFSFSPKIASAIDLVPADTAQVEVTAPAVDSTPAVVVAVPNQADSVDSTVVSTTTKPTVTELPAAASAAKPLTGERKELADALSRLIKDDIRMKIGSQGTRVGTLQKFLNLYENKKSTIDNKYGEGTKKSVTAFQQTSGDEVDGLADPGTYQKMIDWLKSSN
jgi:peptidoglycan hydrolase-like protein with peptidoglycan-binding domain